MVFGAINGDWLSIFQTNKKSMSMKLPTVAATQHDDSSSTSCSSVSVGSLSIDSNTQYDDNDSSFSSWYPRDRSNKRRASWWPYVQVFLICLVTAALAVLMMYLYITHRFLFSNNIAKAAPTKQPTEKKQKSQMYWHKAIERRRHLSTNKCQEATETDSQGTPIPMNELELSTLLLESSSSSNGDVRDSIDTLRKLHQQHRNLGRANNSNNNNNNIRVRDAGNSHVDSSNIAVYDFPRDDEDCRGLYNNVKGLDWIDDKTIITVADKIQAQGASTAAKGKNNSDPPIHSFRIPESTR
jgi:hypothetical protein